MIKVIFAMCLYDLVSVKDLPTGTRVKVETVMLKARAINTDSDIWYMDFTNSLKKLGYQNQYNIGAIWVNANMCNVVKTRRI